MKPVRTMIAATLLAALSSTAIAGATTLTFEGLPNEGQIASTYPGIEFSTNGRVLSSIIQNPAGGLFAYSLKDANGNKVLDPNRSAPSGFNAAAILTDDGEPGDFSITVKKGFSGSFSLWFAGTDRPGGISFFDIDNEEIGPGAYDLLAGDQETDSCEVSVPASGPGQNPGEVVNVPVVCAWRYFEMTDFSTAVYRVQISGPSGLMFFDDITFGRLLSDGNDIPEPGTLALLAAAAGAAALGRRRKAGASQ